MKTARSMFDADGNTMCGRYIPSCSAVFGLGTSLSCIPLRLVFSNIERDPSLIFYLHIGLLYVAIFVLTLQFTRTLNMFYLGSYHILL